MKLFGNNIVPACRYCEKTLRLISNEEQVLCSKYGVVDADYHCRHFVYDPLWRTPPTPKPMQSFTGKEFTL